MNPKTEERNRSIIRYNIIGIVMNLCLAVFKITAGIAAFTVVPDYSVPGRDRDIEVCREEVKEMHPDMMFKIRIGIDV